MRPGLAAEGAGRGTPKSLVAAALAVGPARLGIPGEEAVTSSRAQSPACLAGLLWHCPAPGLTSVLCLPRRRMFSSVAHLARANPFNAPHLQLVHDGPSGPRSPPGPPRRSRHLAAAAVEGEVTPRPCASASCTVPPALPPWLRQGLEVGEGRSSPGPDDRSLAGPGMSALTP